MTKLSIILLLSASGSGLAIAQQELDTVRTKNLLGHVRELSQQFYTSAVAYYNHNDKWPIDSSSLVRFALKNSDTLQLNYLKTLGVFADSSNYLQLKLRLAPTDVRLKSGEKPARVSSLAALVSVSPPQNGSLKHGILVKIFEGIVILPGSDTCYIRNKSNMGMTFVRPDY